MEKDKKKKKEKALAAFAALGIVYGDIGTSPLYALKECFNGEHGAELTQPHVYGVLSLIFWSLILIISVKYLLLIMRADNQGEGGILALMQLVLPEDHSKFKRPFILAIGLFGAALLYGDGILTPAISVLSAVEGLEIVTPDLGGTIVPITILILLLLFWLQKRGTAGVGKLFGPIMLLWFITLGTLGTIQIIQDPEILAALNPVHAFKFISDQGTRSLFTLGAVFLVVTGGEALYADMGHFGRTPIRLAWFTIVLPGLLLNYFGQGALLLKNPEAVENPFYKMAPEWALIPLIILAMLATIIASQAIISGAFSLTFQAIQLNYLPRLRVLHTSTSERGQVYLPKVNILLLICTILVVIAFQTSSNVAVAYGIAITVTMLITDILAFYAMRSLWKWGLLVAAPITVFFFIVDLSFFTSNALKFLEGGWFPILVALIIYILIRAWMKGQRLMGLKMGSYKSPLSEFVQNLDRKNYANVAGTGVYLTSNILNTPSALQRNLKHNKVIHEVVIFMEIGFKTQPMVHPDNHITIDDLGDNFYRILVKYGYFQRVEMNAILALIRKSDEMQELLEDATFFLSTEKLIIKTKKQRNRIEEAIYIFLRKQNENATRYFNIPAEKVFEIGSHIEV